MKNSLVSIIIPAYKAEKFIEETISSVLKQTYKNIEVIVVDDGSPDNLNALVKNIQLTDSRVHYILQPNAGVSQARNNGFKHSNGEFVAFLDADDVWLEECLDKKLHLFYSDPELGLVHSDMEFVDENSTSLGYYNIGKAGYVLDDLLLWEGCVIPAPSSVLIRRRVIDEVGLFDPDLSTAADQEFFFRVASKYKIGRVPVPLGLYRVHTHNMSKNISLLEKDHYKAYCKAKSMGLFHSFTFMQKCFSNMFLIIGASWWGDGKSKIKGIKYLLKAISYYPPNLTKILKKLF